MTILSHSGINAHHARLNSIFKEYFYDYDKIRTKDELAGRWNNRRLDDAEFLVWSKTPNFR